MNAQHTPGPWYVRVQNDMLFVVAGREPALDNDCPWHDAPRVAIAKICYPVEGDELPVNLEENARLIAVGLAMLKALTELTDLVDGYLSGVYSLDSLTSQPARAAIAKATGRVQP